jgi:Serpentine type 7TM GPCR chemoreceptor Srw
MTYYGLADGVNQDTDDAVYDDGGFAAASLSAFNDTGLDAAVAYVYDVDGGRMPGVDELRAFHDWYRMYHGYLSAVVCTFGIVANIANIIVLTRRSMLSAINCILTGLAVSDGLTMAAYLPFALRFYVLYGVEPTPERNEQSAVRFMLFYARFSVVVHTTSIWLTVVMATFRYIFVRLVVFVNGNCSNRYNGREVNRRVL